MSLGSLLTSRSFLGAASVASLSAGCSALIRYMDVNRGHDFLQDWNPEFQVFAMFMTFASLVAGFRIAHALQRYTEAASLLHKMTGCWYDVASTLVAFCRASTAPEPDIEQFQNTALRLISLLSGICLECLETKACHNDIGSRFEIMGWADLDDKTQNSLTRSPCKVEHTFQLLCQLVIDAIDGKVLDIAPPILTRSFQELSSGLLFYHEAKKLSSYSPLPYAYRSLTYVILVCQAALTPLMLASNTKGLVSAFWYTFMSTYLIWFVNGVADTLENPFQKETATLELTSAQSELNLQLSELLAHAKQETPSFRAEAKEESGGHDRGVSTLPSMRVFRQYMNTKFGQAPVDEEKVFDRSRKKNWLPGKKKPKKRPSIERPALTTLVGHSSSHASASSAASQRSSWAEMSAGHPAFTGSQPLGSQQLGPQSFPPSSGSASQTLGPPLGGFTGSLPLGSQQLGPQSFPSSSGSASGRADYSAAASSSGPASAAGDYSNADRVSAKLSTDSLEQKDPQGEQQQMADGSSMQSGASTSSRMDPSRSKGVGGARPGSGALQAPAGAGETAWNELVMTSRMSPTGSAMFSNTSASKSGSAMFANTSASKWSSHSLSLHQTEQACL